MYTSTFEVLSLKEIILKSLDFDELYKLSITNKAFKHVFDCSWDIWREYARINFKVPYDYFDLPRLIQNRNISGVERYLEIANFYEIFKNPVTFSDIGVYDLVKVIKEALYRNDSQAISYFYDFLSEEEKDYIKTKFLSRTVSKNIEAYLVLSKKLSINIILSEGFITNILYSDVERCYRKKLEELIIKGNKEAHNTSRRIFPEDYSMFSCYLKSGRIEFIEPSISEHLGLDKNFFIRDHIKIIPFSVDKKDFPLSKIIEEPLLSERKHELLAYAVYGCNPQVVDFFRCYFNTELDSSFVEMLCKGYREHRKPVEAYSILQRIDINKGKPCEHCINYELTSTENLDLFFAVNTYETQSYNDLHEIILGICGNTRFLKGLLSNECIKSLCEKNHRGSAINNNYKETKRILDEL